MFANNFSADKPSWCLARKTRIRVRERGGLRLTPAEAGVLVFFRAPHPWQLPLQPVSADR